MHASCFSATITHQPRLTHPSGTGNPTCIMNARIRTHVWIVVLLVGNAFEDMVLVGCLSEVWGHELFLDVV